MVLLNGSNLSKSFMDETLFSGVSFNVDSSDKIGFVGVNGAGKSTLFKIIIGDDDYDDGEIFRSKSLKIGYLNQYSVNGSTKSIYDEVLSVFSDVMEIEAQLEEVRYDIENGGDVDALIRRQTHLQDLYAASDGFYYKSKVKSALMGLGFGEEEFGMCVDNLSGGQKTRVALAKILLSDANLLLLDEPTNHLDIDSTEWLEEFLKGYNGAFIVISHDRYFLDKVTNKTFELSAGHFRSYNGNYSAYAAQREIEKKSEERAYENTVREIERLEGIVEQQRRWNRERNYKIIDNKMKSIERLEKSLVQPVGDTENIRFAFKAASGGGQDVLVTEDLAKGFGSEPLFRHADLLIKKGEKVFLLGPNGCGKTTFLKIITGEYEPTEGFYKIGANISIGYYDQLRQNLNMNKTVIDEVWDEYPNMTQTQIRSALAVFLFRGEDVFKEIHKLSGGERARVELTKLMLKSVNFLIMDEPTNHLDIESLEALENALSSYDGTMLVVSHDRYFINKLADRVVYLTPNGLESHRDDYDSFSERSARVAEGKKESVGAADYKERKRLESLKRKMLSRFAKVEDEISKREEAIENLNAELEDPEAAADYVKACEITERIASTQEEIEKLMEEWESLQITIEESGYDI